MIDRKWRCLWEWKRQRKWRRHYQLWRYCYQKLTFRNPTRRISNSMDEAFVTKIRQWNLFVKCYLQNDSLRTSVVFFWYWKTNVDCQVVGAFVCEGESTENILTALRILKCWNPDWNPLYSMVDCCSQEINAAEELFPGIIMAY